MLVPTPTDPSVPCPRIAVVGTGAVGSAVCALLLARKQAHVLLIDPDTVEPRNLPLSPLLQRADRLSGSGVFGHSKVEAILSLARQQTLPWQARASEIADVGYGVLAEYDVLLCCPDSALARVETTLAARSLCLPMLDAGVRSAGVPEGRVTLFAPSDEAACYLCGLPETRRAELLSFALSPSLGCTVVEQPEPMTGEHGTVQSTAQELVRLLDETLNHTPYPNRSRTAGRPQAHNQAPMRAQTQNATQAQMQAPGQAQTQDRPQPQSFARRIFPAARRETIHLRPSPSCPWHRLPLPGELVALPYTRPLNRLLRPGTLVEFAWPICLDARCLACGHRWNPRRRTASVRRTLRCPACGLAGHLDPLHSLHAVEHGSPFAGQSLRQLGLPERHLYHVRSTHVASMFPARLSAT